MRNSIRSIQSIQFGCELGLGAGTSVRARRDFFPYGRGVSLVKQPDVAALSAHATINPGYFLQRVSHKNTIFGEAGTMTMTSQFIPPRRFERHSRFPHASCSVAVA